MYIPTERERERKKERERAYSVHYFKNLSISKLSKSIENTSYSIGADKLTKRETAGIHFQTDMQIGV